MVALAAVMPMKVAAEAGAKPANDAKWCHHILELHKYR